MRRRRILRATIVAGAVALGGPLGLVAGAQIHGDDPTVDEPRAATRPSKSASPFAIDCPAGLSNSSMVLDYGAPAEGSVQNRHEALDDLLSWYSRYDPMLAGNAGDFEFEGAGDGAVRAVLEGEGGPPLIVYFSQLAPEYWVVGQVLKCEEEAFDE
jgi:hypothetical protein